ncbi:hypothetical protein H2248_003430 [Termitomyces sp. 'cryptogamus']|nr:hypothetical protein H2248_003430 [Termitomyces sp. 'cryptogamus']
MSYRGYGLSEGSPSKAGGFLLSLRSMPLSLGIPSHLYQNCSWTFFLFMPLEMGFLLRKRPGSSGTYAHVVGVRRRRGETKTSGGREYKVGLEHAKFVEFSYGGHNDTCV